jgi:hypothetical protein
MSMLYWAEVLQTPRRDCCCACNTCTAVVACVLQGSGQVGGGNAPGGTTPGGGNTPGGGTGGGGGGTGRGATPGGGTVVGSTPSGGSGGGNQPGQVGNLNMVFLMTSLNVYMKCVLCF